MTTSNNKASEIDNAVRQESRNDFEALSLARIKNLLANPDLSKSQKKVLLNLLHRLED